MATTPSERAYLAAVHNQLERLQALLREIPDADADAEDWFRFLAVMKAIQGNASNDLSFVATLLARDYLTYTLPLRLFDATAKPQGAPGLDIDQRTADGRRVVAEIKTTTPYQGSDLGAAQKKSFAADFAKLAAAEAEHKFLFVTDERTFEVLGRRYRPALAGVNVVLLPHGLSFVG